MEKKDRYHLVIDYMRFFAILAVIGIHTTTRLLEAYSFNISRIELTFFLNQITRFAVPLFFMISGFVLEINYPYHQNYFSYLKKRFSRIFIPYLIWSLIYYIFVYKQHTVSFLPTLLYGSSSYQLYFIPTLLIFYIIFPFLHNSYKFISNLKILGLLTFVQFILLAWDYYIKPLPIFFPVSIFLLNYLLFILGMIASHHHEIIYQRLKRFKKLIIVLLIFFACIVSLEGGVLYLNTHNYLFFYSQWRPSILIYTLLLASILFVIFHKSDRYAQKIKLLSKLSFFVFFIHVAILELLWFNLIQPIFINTRHTSLEEIWWNMVFFILVTSTSYVLAYLVHKIHFLPKLFG